MSKVPSRALQGARETIQRFKPRLAIGAYHEADDHKIIPEIVQWTRADYEIQCLRCLPAHNLGIGNAIDGEQNDSRAKGPLTRSRVRLRQSF